MADDIYKGRGWLTLIRNLSFIAFGITIFSDPFDRFNLYNIGFGIIVFLLFGWIFKKFLRGFLALFNPALKKEHGKAAIYYSVENGLLFLVPFAVLALIATFYLNWSMINAFFSTSIMVVGTATAIEIGKLKGKQNLKNTIITSGVAFLFSFIFTLSLQFIIKAPGLIEGVVNLIPTLFSQGGGSL